MEFPLKLRLETYRKDVYPGISSNGLISETEISVLSDIVFVSIR